MASTKQEITKPFSRMKNGLIELQAFYPAYVKNDGVGGLSIDPVLYRTTFGSKTASEEGGLEDESNTAGIRAEVIDDDGSNISGTYTLTISGSGTFNPRCSINYDGSTYAWMLIAPDGEDTNVNNGVYGHTAGPVTKAGAGAPKSEFDFAGPHPVFMTVQECAEMIDTYRNISLGTTGLPKDENKPAWLPHKLEGRGSIADADALSSMDDDPRITSQQMFLTNELKLRATVFMPMMLDNNQLSKNITGASVGFAYPHSPRQSTYGWTQDGYVEQGITRYDHDPEGSDSATIKYKTVGYSGDHLTGAVGAWSNYQDDTFTGISVTHTFKSAGGGDTTSIGFSNPDISLDSASAIGPKYRMRMALACFLKDGTYTLNDGGAIIPYIYDPDRTIGGVSTTTLYSVWDGQQGYGNSQPITADCSAQIYPMFDFVQGPICPAAQGSNFDASAAELEHPIWPNVESAESSQSDGHTNPRQFLVRPNPTRIEIIGTKKDTNGVWSIYVDASNHTFAGGIGMPIYVSGLGGELGTGTNNPDLRWDALDTDNWENDSDNGNDIDHNGWWIMRSVSARTTGDFGIGVRTYQEIQVYVRNNIFGGSGLAVEAATGYVCQGRMMGYAENGGVGRNNYGIIDPNDTTSGVKGTGTGFFAGVSQPDTTTPVGASTDSTYPSRPTLYQPEQPNSDGKVVSATNFTARSISIRSDTDDTFATSPTVSSEGGGVLRIPPPLGWDLAKYYYSIGRQFTTGGTGSHPDYDAGGTPQTISGPPNARWGFRGVHIPFWSFIDANTGRHAWDYVKPTNWQFGRNRPFPPHERIGTRLAYSPSLYADASSGGYTATASGNYLAAGEESTKYGLTEMGCSPIWLDMEMRAFVPIRDDRLFLVEFDNGVSFGKTGRHSMLTHGGTQSFEEGHGFYGKWDGSGVQYHPTASGSTLYGQEGDNPTYTVNRPSIWAWGANTEFFTAEWANSLSEFPIGSATAIGGNHGWGGLGNGYGYGTPQTLTEGTHTMRAVFTEAGMTYILDGKTVGTDANSAQPIWGMTIKVGDALALGANSLITNDQDGAILTQRPNVNMSHADLQIDSLVLRQIPTPPMLPYKVDTMKQTVANVAKYNSLVVEAENVDSNKGMRITATLLEPALTFNGIEQSPSTVITGFDDVDLEFLGGIGSMNLTDLPSSAITNGFVIRFNFYIPDSTQTEYHPINWNKIPIIRNWELKYDLKPSASLSVTGNTFNGDTTTPIGMKVGHVVSFRGTLSTTDTDRTISQVKFDFGDGSITGWIDVADQTLTSTTYDASHVYTKAGDFEAVVYAKDDNGNESSASNQITVETAETLPVAVLKASPSIIYANNTITLNGESSFIVSSDSARTIASYTFTAGDGSASVTQAGSSLTHTYTSAGEYEATLTVTDNASSPNTSTSSTVVVKVLAANTAVDLFAQLNTRPSSFSRKRNATIVSIPTLDGTYPTVTDSGQRDDTFVLTGTFLKGTATTDIETMEGYLTNGTLLEIEWETTDYDGNASVKTFTGRMIDFDYEREGGRHGETPYTAIFVRDV